MKKYLAPLGLLLVSATSFATITADQQYQLNHMNQAAFKNSLGDAIVDAGNGSTLANGKVWVGSSGGVSAAVTPSGDVTISNAGVTAIGAGKVTEAMIKPEAVGVYGLNVLRVARFVYNFATDGGASATTVTLTNSATLPAGSLMLYGWVDVPTAVTTSASGTLAFKCSSAGDILGTTSAATLSSNALVAGTNDWTAANMKRNASACTVVATIATGALTAGKVVGHVVYSISP